MAFHLIAGLGNPGAEYTATRHNAGFMVVERLGQRWSTTWSTEDRFAARLGRTEVAGAKVLLCQPSTYMNHSGQAVGALSAFYQVPREQLLVVLDDADLPLGTLRLRPEGGSGGHHGLESVIQHLGHRDFARLRLGIGRRHPDDRRIERHVLGRFLAEERPLWDQVLDRAVLQVECWLTRGLQPAMNQFNGMIELSGTKEN